MKQILAPLMFACAMQGAAYAESKTAGLPSEIVFVDRGVDGASALASAIRPGVETVVLEPGKDAVGQISQALAVQQGLKAVHLVSHAEPGKLLLGGRKLTAAEFARPDLVAAMRHALGERGGLYLYGCDLAAGAKGEQFRQEVARATQADVFASVDATGAPDLGGNWVLEAGPRSVAQTLPLADGFQYRGLLPASQVIDPNFNPIYVRPGQASVTWTVGQHNSSAGAGLPGGPVDVLGINYYNVPDPGFNWILTRGKFQYSTNGGSSWVDYPYGQNQYVPVAGKLWRFLDTSPADTTSMNNFGTSWSYVSYGATTSTGSSVTPDNPPTDVFPKSVDYWGTAATGDIITHLSKSDTGRNEGTYTLDSQQVANLFTLTGDTLSKGTGALPAVGTGVTLTLRYRDYYQTDSAGNPLANEGVVKTVTMVRRDNPVGFTNDGKANTFTANAQGNSQVAGLSDGTYVVVWRSPGQDGETTAQGGIYAQRYDAAGAKVGSEFAISPAPNSKNETLPVVAALPSGRFVVAYQQANTDGDIVYRLVETNNSLSAEMFAPSSNTGAQSTPAVAALSNGNFAITWIGTNGTDTADVWVRVFAGSNGAPVASSERAVNTNTVALDVQGNPVIAGLSDGNAVLSWRDPSNGNDVRARIVSPTGFITNEFDVAGGVESQTNTRVTSLTGGGFVIAYSAAARNEGGAVDGTSESNIYFKRYDNSGALQGSETLANANTRMNQTAPSISRLSGGGFVIGWVSNTDPDDSNGLFARRFGATGTAVDSYDFQLNQARTGVQNALSLGSLANNGFALSWSDTALDGASNAGIGTRAFVVSASNNSPTVANAIPDQNATEDSAFSFAFAANTFNDADAGQTLTYSATNVPAWLTFNAGTRSFSGTPAQANVGFADITVTATDNGSPTGSVSDVFRITVAAFNDAPVVANAIPDQSAAGGSPFSFTFAANTFNDEENGTNLSYSTSGVPAWLSFNAASRSFTGTPGQADVGFADITVTATDSGGKTVSDTFRITVTSTNPTATALYLKGGAVPNAGTDARIQTGALWNLVGTPAINDSGKIAYLGKWRAPSVTGASPVPAQVGAGIFLDDTLVVKAGEAVPGAGSGSLPSDAKFKSFKDPVLDAGGHVAFLAAITGTGVVSTNDSVVVSNGRTGALEVLAREGGVAPGTTGATFKVFSNVSVQGTSVGGTIFTASLLQQAGSPTVTSANDSGAWWLPAGEAAVLKLAREGDAGFLSGETIKSITVLKGLSGSPGSGRGQASANSALIRLTLGGGSIARQAQVLAQAGTLTEVAATGDLIGSGVLTAATWKTMSLPAFGNQGQRLAVLGSLTPGVGGVLGTNAKGIFVSTDSGTTWDPAVRAGDAALGQGTGVIFSGFRDPVHSSTDSGIAFLGTIKGGAVVNADNDTLWWKPSGGSLVLVAREGAQAPGAPVGAKWKSFSSMALPGNGSGPLFTASLQRGLNGQAGPGNITSIDDVALYAVDSHGTVREVIRENQPLAGKVVKSFNVLKAISGSAGSTRSFNANHQVAAFVTFTDKSAGIVKIVLP